jgi:tetratricopeptide (TPR) repeat protein
LIHAGRPEEALDFVKTAMRFDPNYPAYYLFVLGLAHFNRERFEEAANSFERALKRNPINYVPLIHLAAAYGHLGRKQEAAAAIQKLNKALPIVSVDFVSLPFMSRYKDPVDKDRLLDGLRKAGLPETPYDVLYKAGEK